MKYKKSVILSFTTLFLCGVIAGTVLTNNILFNASAESTSYSIKMANEKNEFHTYTDDTARSGEDAIIKTELGNDVKFKYSNLYGASDSWHILASEVGSFNNTDPIHGLLNVSIGFKTSSAVFKIYWSNDPLNFSEENSVELISPTSSDEKLVFNFNETFPNYFKVENTGEVNLNISSIDIEYDCIGNYPILNVYSENEAYGTVSGDSGPIHVGNEVSITATPSIGYGFIGWYENSELVSTEATYTFTMPYENLAYEARWEALQYTIEYVLDGGTNHPDNPSTYTINDSFELLPAEKSGYNFNGWTLNDEPITEIEIGTYGNITLVASWTIIEIYTLKTVINDETMGSITGAGDYAYGSSVTIFALPNVGYEFIGWFENESVLITTKLKFVFTMPRYNVSYLAMFERSGSIDWDKEHGVIPVVDEENKTITYGLYPQTVVTDEDLIDELSSLGTTFIDERNNWYFYKDEFYTKITSTPYDSGYKFDNGNSISSNTVYWFKCESIKWRILTKPSDSEYFVISEKLLDGHRYFTSSSNRTNIKGEGKVYSNNYKYSDIRAWLNGYDASDYGGNNYTDSSMLNKSFIGTAFSLNFTHIETTEVDNSAATTDSNNNPYACANTNDKIFLLSYQDYCSSYFDGHNDKKCITSDYARATGTYSYNYGIEDIKKCGIYWTRSADSTSLFSNYLWAVVEDGYFRPDAEVTKKQIGARPGMVLKIS